MWCLLLALCCRGGCRGGVSCFARFAARLVIKMLAQLALGLLATGFCTGFCTVKSYHQDIGNNKLNVTGMTDYTNYSIMVNMKRFILIFTAFMFLEFMSLTSMSSNAAAKLSSALEICSNVIVLPFTVL